MDDLQIAWLMIGWLVAFWAGKDLQARFAQGGLPVAAISWLNIRGR